MDLHLNHVHRESIRVFVDGALMGELAVGVFDGRDTLDAEVRQARCLYALRLMLVDLGVAADQADAVPDHTATTPIQKQAAFLRGLRDGLAGRMEPNRLPGVPPVPPEHSPAYRRGYHEGEGLRLVLAHYDAEREKETP